MQKKLLALRARIKKLDGAIIAFSGGVNSTLLLRIAREELGNKAVAVTSVDENYPKGDLKITRRIASLMNIKHTIAKVPEGNNCMGKFYGGLKKMSQMNGASVLSGFHEDKSEDDFDFAAATNMGVAKPLLECDLSKAEIRMLAKELGLPNYDIEQKGKTPTDTRLDKLEKAKKYLKTIGANSCLVLMNGKKIQIVCEEGTRGKLTKKIPQLEKKLKGIGFSKVLIKEQ